MALAQWSEKHPRFGQIWMAISAMSLALLATLFALGIHVGGLDLPTAVSSGIARAAPHPKPLPGGERGM
jgi:hypothetical protein